MRKSLSWWLGRPFRVVAGLWRRDPEYLERLGLGRFAVVVPSDDSDLPGRDLAASGWCADADLEFSATGLFENAFQDLAPIRTYPDPLPTRTRRLTLLIDALDPGGLLDPIAVSLLFAVALVRHRGFRLRVVTRTAPANALVFGTVLKAHGLTGIENVEFEYTALDAGARQLAVSDQDLILTTSWRMTWSALGSFAPSRIIFLVQEDERALYAAGDERLRCREIYCTTPIRFVISTERLREALIADGMAGIVADSVAFEPAFPLGIYDNAPRAPSAKRQFLFYTNPDQPQSLFYRGIEAIASAIQTDILSPSDWDFTIMGRGIPRLVLPRGVRPTLRTVTVDRPETALIPIVDVGLSLSDTLHPGYAPIAIVASGAIAVTNRDAKPDLLEAVSANMICAVPTSSALAAALGAAAQLAGDAERRRLNRSRTCINRDWSTAFAPALQALVDL